MGKWPNDFVVAFSDHDIDAVLSCFADDTLYEEVVADGIVARGKQELCIRIQGIFDAFPDMCAAFSLDDWNGIASRNGETVEAIERKC